MIHQDFRQARRFAVTAICVWLVLSAVTAFAGTSDSFYTCQKLASPPKIDGIIDAQEWAGTEEGGPLVITKTGATATNDTRFRIGYDSKRIYTAIICRRPNASQIVAKITRRDGEVWTDESAELSIDPAHEHVGMTKIIVNTLGTVCDFRYGCYEWNARIDAASHKAEDYWSTEFSVPFSDMGRPAPKPGEVWGLNVYRGGSPEMLNWVNSFGVFTDPDLMGHLVFANPGRPLPSTIDVHKKLNYKLQPELQRHGPTFEGKPWGPLENEIAEDQSLRSDLVTPHIRMSGPFKSGPIRALVFVGMHGNVRDAAYETRVRDTVELRQRFHVEPTAAYIFPTGPMGGPGGERRLRALLEEKWDVFILAGCETKSIPEQYFSRVAAQVSEGAGLVCVNNEREWLSTHGKKQRVPSEVRSSLPIESLAHYPPMSKRASGFATGSSPILSAYTVGKGRALAIAYGGIHSLTPELGLSDENLVDYEYWIGLAGFAANWAAGRSQQVSLQMPRDLEIRRSNLQPDYNIVVSSGTVGKADIEVYLRSSDGARTLVSKQVIGPKSTGQTQVAVPLPIVPYGPYYVEARVLQAGSVVGFGAAKIRVTGENAIDQFTLNRDMVERGDNISGSFKLVPGTGSARVELVTRDDRVIARRDFTAPEEPKFSFDTSTDTTLEMRVRLSVIDDYGVVQTSDRGFNVPYRCRDEFQFIMWNSAMGPLGYHAYRNLRQEGFNVCLLPEAVSRRNDFSSVAYATYISNKRDEQGFTRQGCWYNEPWIGHQIAGIAESQREYRKHGVCAYSLGDESDTLGCCLHPACFAAYRKYLAKSYASIEALNASWGENYKSFDEVQLLKDDDFFRTSEAFVTGKYSRWMDRQRFAEISFADLCSRYGKAFKEIDPQAVTGFEGSGTYRDDVDALLENNGMWTPYNSVLDDILRTIWPKETIHGNWIGYSKDIDHLAAVAWRSIALGANSVWWWRWEGTGWTRGFISPGLDLWPVTKQLMKEMQVVRDGLGPMLASADWEDDGVAILYSVESALADQIPEEEHFGKGEAAHSAFIHMLKDTGIQYRYVTPGRIARGALRGAKVLMLPHCMALDPSTVEAIRSFVNSGGTLIADIRPAARDGHANALPQGGLDDVFGVKRANSGTSVLLDSPVEVRTDFGSFSISDLRAAADSAYSSAGATVGCTVNGVQLFLSNRYGKGRAVLLNCTPDSYEGFRDRPVAAEIRAPVLAACEAAGVRPTITMESVSGDPVLLTELSRLNTGSGRIVSLRLDYVNWMAFLGTASPTLQQSRVKVVLDRPQVVYDLRNGKCLGEVSSFMADLKAGYANFYGVFDQPVPTTRLACKTEPSQGTTRLTAGVEIGGPKTAVLMQLVDPSGQKLDWSRRVVLTKDGSAQSSWQLPVNGPERYRLEARELFTGKSVVEQVAR